METPEDLKECIRLMKSRAAHFERLGDTVGADRAKTAVERFAAQLAEITDGPITVSVAPVSSQTP